MKPVSNKKLRKEEMNDITEIIEEALAEQSAHSAADYQREEEWENYLKTHPIEKFEYWLEEHTELPKFYPQTNTI
jgi:hypothetical protein